MKEVSR